METAPRPVIGITYLKKACLVYELTVRKTPTDGTASELAQRLRGVLDRPLTLSVATLGEVSTACASCAELISDARESVEILERIGASRSQLSRVQAYCQHLFGRVDDLLKVFTEEAHRPQIFRMQADLCALQQRVGLMGWQGEGSVEVPQANSGMNVETESGHSGFWHKYAKLPNPLLAILNEYTFVSIDNGPDAMSFLRLTVLLEERAVAFQLTHLLILQLLFPLARGILSEMLADALQNQPSLGEFRKLVIREAIGVRMKHNLVQEYCFRVQRGSETLSRYIESIRLSCLALELNIQESEVVQLILEGMRPQDRGSLVLCDRPRSFTDLRQVVFTVESTKFADAARAGSMVADRQIQGGGESHDPATTDSRRWITCYRCRQPGHMVRNCPHAREKT